MIIFHNPGDLDLEAVRLMGASVKAAGSFGRFGTGLKYAVATVLRGGGRLHMYISGREFGFGTLSREVKGETFAEVILFEYIDGEAWGETPLGFTTALGKDWEPWMAVRELACNARDEGGSFTRWEDPNWDHCGEGTEIALDWPELEASWDETLKELFVPDDLNPLEEVEGILIHPGESGFLYHRGVRVMKLPKKAAFTYNIIAPVDLTEDRTAKYAFIVEENVRRALFLSQDPGIIAAALTNTKGWEGSLKWLDDTWNKPVPGVLWLEEIARLRTRRESLPEGAVKLFLQHRAVKEAKHFGGYYRDETPPSLDIAMGALESLRVELGEEDIYVTRELPAGSMSMASGGRIYLSEELIQQRPYLVARELLTRHFELSAAGDHDKLLEEAVELLLRAHRDLDRDRELYLEEIAGKEVLAA